MHIDGAPRVADYFVTVGLNDLKKPDNDGETLEPITDLAVIFKSLGEVPPPGYECIEFTPTGFQADLNHGSIRTPSCYLCYKRGRDKPPLTDIGVLYEGKQRLMHGCDVVLKTPTKLVANVNNTNNMRIFITYRRASPQFAHSSLAVIEICVVLTNKGEKPPHAFCLIGKGLNQGLVGSDVYLCYRKSLARTNSLSYSAEIISRYPSIDNDSYGLPDCVPLFCLPLGAVVECWPELAKPPLPIFSTFALTGATGEKIFGAGVTFFEEFPSSQFTPEVEDLINQQQENHKDQRVVAQTNKCICLLSRYPFFDAFRRFLMSLYRLTVSGIQSLPIERYISHFMHNVPFPTRQKPRVFVQLTHEGFEVVEPSHGPLPISGASFTALLRCLGTENTLLLLYCLLTEQKILIHSLRPALLTSVGEALVALIFPFQWKCPFIPMCPLKLADVLSAPFPFIYGIDSRYFDQQSPPEDVTCVDLDTNMITLAIDQKDSKSGKVLPKRPGKILKDRLDSLFLMLHDVANEDNPSAVEMAPLDVDVTAAKTKKFIEVSIREAFLRFHAQILKGYKQYLLPITSRPDIGSRDITTLFDLQGFVRSRLRGTERFFQLLTKTQLFCHFIESRSLSSTNDAVLAFFDYCTEKCEETMELLPKESFSSNYTTVVVTPPDASGLPPGEIYTYNGFPKLRDELFTLVSPVINKIKQLNASTPPRSPIVGRTPHERQQGSVSAKKQSNSPILWARCLLGHCYTLWFIQLPAYVKFHRSKEKILYKAFEVLQKISNPRKSRAKLPDEVCFRILMQLSGQFNHPALAVKVLFEMKRVGLQPNAVTWGYYHKAVLEGQWLPDEKKRSPKQLWNKLKLAYMAMNGFKKALQKNENKNGPIVDISNSFDTSTSISNNILIPIETSSNGTLSDGGYGSGLMSTEDLRPPQPVAGGLIDFSSTDLPNNITSQVKSKSISNQDLSKTSSNGHKRNFSLSSQTSESDNEFLTKTLNKPKHPLVRRLSETSVGSNLSENQITNLTNNHIIVYHDGSLQELHTTSNNHTEQQGNKRSTIALEAVICSCQICDICDKVIYDEEVMGAWSADDSNLNIVCPFCDAKRVPKFNIKIKDYRGLASKLYNADNRSSDNLNDKVTKSFSNPLLSLNEDNLNNSTGMNPSNNQLNNSLNKIDTNSSNDNVTDQLEQFFSMTSQQPAQVSPQQPPTQNKLQSDLLIDISETPSNPVPIKGNKRRTSTLSSSSAPTSTSSSPSLGSTGRPAFYRHRKTSSNCSGNLNMFIGSPEESTIDGVPYLSPLVLRKELENLLDNDGDGILQTHEIVTEKPIIFWNMIWYFRRLGLHSHLPTLLLQSYNESNPKDQAGVNNTQDVVISTSWDTNRQTDSHVPMYMMWNLSNEQQEYMNDQGFTPKSLLSTISSHIQRNDVVQPMKMLLDERTRQQNNNIKIHWSLYRELLYLSLSSCGGENIDIDAFDREYKVAMKEILREYSEKIQPDDKHPSAKAVFCRRMFDPPTLQPRKARIRDIK